MKTNKILLLAVIVILITSWSCDITDLDLDLDPMEYDLPEYITFEDVSQPYLEQYGQPKPEDIYEYISGSYHSIDWWWWHQGFSVNFLLSPYDDIYGWTIDSTYSFPPI